MTRRLFLQDDVIACKCDACFVVWYKWTLEQLPEDHWSPDLADLPDKLSRLHDRFATHQAYALYVLANSRWRFE